MERRRTEVDAVPQRTADASLLALARILVVGIRPRHQQRKDDHLNMRLSGALHSGSNPPYLDRRCQCIQAVGDVGGGPEFGLFDFTVTLQQREHCSPMSIKLCWQEDSRTE